MPTQLLNTSCSKMYVSVVSIMSMMSVMLMMYHYWLYCHAMLIFGAVVFNLGFVVPFGVDEKVLGDL